MRYYIAMVNTAVLAETEKFKIYSSSHSYLIVLISTKPNNGTAKSYISSRDMISLKVRQVYNGIDVLNFNSLMYHCI